MAAKKPPIVTTFDFIVVGGGIAAVSCTEYLSYLNNEAKICLISSMDLIKTVSNLKKLAQTIEEFDVVERPLESMATKCSNVTVVKSAVIGFDAQAHKVITSDLNEYQYRKLCICSGARPKLIAEENEHVLGLRDLQSVQYFQNRLSTARRVIIVGNGGIALELVYELSGCEVIWVIKDDSIGNAYLDKGAAQFFLQNLKMDLNINDEKIPHQDTKAASFSTTYGQVTGDEANTNVSHQQNRNPGKTEYAGALGDGWKSGLKLEKSSDEHNVHLEYDCNVKAIFTQQEYICQNLSKDSLSSHKKNMEWNIYAELTNDKTYGCDFVISATGVVPNTEPFLKHASFNIASDGGLKVDDHMRTNITDVYAAGDVCSVSWEHSEYWMQMRLWTQANQMGAYAAKCMIADSTGDEIFMDFCFELFAHVTRFFDYKVILLGKFNGQDLGNDYQVLLRCTEGEEYIKVVVHQGKVHGALLIGDTDLEETLENLILNQLDISAFGEHLLDPNIDIDDYFD